MSIASNVTTPPPHAPRNTPHAGALAECSRLLRQHCARAMHAAHATLAVEIDARWRKTYDASESETLGEVLRALVHSGDTLPNEFTRALDCLTNHTAPSPEASRTHRAQHFADVVLSLVDDVVFSESLLIDNLARQLHSASENELRELMPRIDVLLGANGGPTPAFNPIAPERVAEALKEACWSVDCGLAARQALLGIVAERIATALPAAYRAINAYLIERKVLPRVRQSPRHADSGKHKLARPASEAASLLRSLVSDDIAPAVAAPRAHAANDEVIDALTRLQHGQHDFNLRGQSFNIEAHTNETMNIIRALLDAGVNRQVAKLDGAIIDIVATLFDFIFDDDRVPPLMKGLIGRLQLPVLKLALADHAFFSERKHPARRLINTLAQASSTWDGAFDTESSLYLIAEPLVEHIQDSGGTDSQAFETSLAALDAFLNEQERLADERASALTDQLTEREISEIARSVGAGAVAPHLANESLPEVIRSLLGTHWASVLANAARDGGENGDAWMRAHAAMEELVWSIQPKSTAKERQRLVRLLPSLIEHLKRGLESVGMRDAERHRFFSELVKLQAQAVKSGMQHAPDATASASAATPSEPEFLPDDGLDQLKRGDWIEMQLEAGPPHVVRLTWISPAGTMFLFANRQGVRGLALTRGELARKFESGEALLIDDEPLMDRLVADALDHYQPD